MDTTEKKICHLDQNGFISLDIQSSLVSEARNILNQFKNIITMIHTYQTSQPDSPKRVISNKYKFFFPTPVSSFLLLLLKLLKDKRFFAFIIFIIKNH